MNSLIKPKLSLNRINQIIFTFREVTKLTAESNPRLLLLSFVLNILAGFASIPGFYLEKLILDRLVANIGNELVQSVVWPILFLVGLRLSLGLATNFLTRINGFIQRRLSIQFESTLERLIGNKLAGLDLATIEDSEFQDRFKKIESESGRRAWGLMMPLADVPNYLTGFITSTLVLVLLHPIITIGIILVSLPQILIDSRFIKKEYELDTTLAPLRRLWGWISYYLVRNRNFMELKILGISPYLSHKLERIQNKVNSRRIALYKKRISADLLAALPLAALELAISVWLIFLTLTAKITIGSFEFYLRSLRSAQSNLTGLVYSLLEIYENYIYVTDLVWFLGLEAKIESSSSSIKIDNKSTFTIRADNLWFRYKPDQDWTIKGVNFDISPGQIVAIVGKNGAGKSTLIKLLARFYDPQKGSITVGGNNLTNIDLTSWRSALGILFQDFESYPFSAKESIGYGDIKRINADPDIKHAAELSGIRQYIDTLPRKFNNPLNPQFEKGVDLSKGQWQRIGISRMLFRSKARLVILDEPTSNVDPEAEEKIFNQLGKLTKDKILIFVTQRFSTVRIADKILVVDEGKIVEAGSHQQLMKQKGKYHKLFTLQAKGYQ